MVDIWRGFTSVWLVDFEYSYDQYGLPKPFCMVAKNYFTRQEIRLWGDELTRRKSPPFPIGPTDIFVAYSAHAEASAFLALGWPQPVTVLDPYVEMKLLTNGRKRPQDFKLVSVLQALGLPHMDVAEKQTLQDRCGQGPPFTAEERAVLSDYCAEDSVCLERLLPVIAPYLHLPQSFLRGRYMWNLARLARHGIPMDYDGFTAFQQAGERLTEVLINEYDRPYGAFKNGHFTHRVWLAWCTAHNIPWPVTATGLAETKGKTFSRMAREYPDVAIMAELQATLDQLKQQELHVYPDGRHRPWLNPFGTLTGRNMPSPTQYIFGAPAWMRGYIQAPPGYAFAHIDWSGQEIGVVAALSDDREMIAMYNTGDPHLAFGQRIGLIPTWVTKEGVKATHSREREICKVLLFGVNYGMSKYGFARRANIPLLQAELIIDRHRYIFRRYWEWVEEMLETAFLRHSIETCFGWRFHINRWRSRRYGDGGFNARTIQDFPAQATGAEIMRLAVIWGLEAGLPIGGVVHDAIVLTSPLERIEADVAQCQYLMEMAGKRVLNGFRLFSEAKVYLCPGRMLEPRGEHTWNIVQETLEKMAVG
jgi:DNA polymerase-1